MALVLKQSRRAQLSAGLALALLGLTGVAPSASAQVPRLSVEHVIGQPDLRDATMSENGRYIAGIMNDAEGDVLIVFDRETKKTTPIQRARADKSLELTFVRFKGNDRVIFGLLQKYEIVAGRAKSRTARAQQSGEEGFGFVSRVFASDLDGKNLISLYSPEEEQGFPRWLSARLNSILPTDPDHVLMVVPHIGGSELRKVNVRTGEATAIEQGTSRTVQFVLDNTLTPVMREDSTAGGRGTTWSRRPPGSKEWIEIATYIGAQRANGAPEFSVLGPAEKPGQVTVTSRPGGRDTNGIYIYDTTKGEIVETIYEHDAIDAFDVVRDGRTGAILASCYIDHKRYCESRDPAFGTLWNGLVLAAGEEMEVDILGGRPLDGDVLFSLTGPREPGAYFIYERDTGAVEFFQRSRPRADKALMPTQHVHPYKAKDGTDLWGYLWLPPGATLQTRNLPTIILPHGGPEGRDVWGFDPMATYWSSQGYAVMQPNFRGGSGFGRKFTEAGWGQWGQLMQQDVRDATTSLIATGIADKDRICVAGWSYGGYVAFTASFQDADLFKCSFAGAGISDLNGMQEWVRENQGGTTSISYRYWAQAIGRDADKLERHSALQNIEKVAMPLFIVHGEIDPIVPVEQSEMMIKALKKADKPFQSLIIPDMDHNFRPDQADGWRDALTQGAAFFARHIGPGWSPTAP